MHGMRFGGTRLLVVRGLGCMVVLLVAVVVLVPGVAFAESLCTDTWSGPGEGSWLTAADWSTGVVPSSTDVACIGAGKKVTVTEGTNQTGVVQGAGALVISGGGSLEVADALEVSSIASLTVRGSLVGAATVDVSSSLTWAGSGIMSGTGATVVLSGASGAVESGVKLVGRSFVNEGTTTLVKAAAGVITESEGAKISNSGTFKANAESGPPEIKKGTGAASIVNTGTFEKAEGSGLTEVAVSFENLGTVRSQAGKLVLAGGGSGAGGTWSAAEGASFALHTGSFSLNGDVFSGAVTLGESVAVTERGLKVESALLTVTQTSSLTVQTGSVTVKSFSLNGSTLTGAGTLNVSGTLTLEGNNGKMSGTGSTVVLPGASGTINGGNKLEGRLLVNEGSLTLVRGTAGTLTESEGARVDNSGTFMANAESGPPEIKQGTGAASIVNTGVFEKTDGVGTTEVEPSFENLGTIRQETGHLTFLHAIVAESSTQYGGGENPSAVGQLHASCGDPVSCATGNDAETQVDLSVGGRGVGLDLSRTYNSQAGAAGEHGAFGYGWTSSFSDRLVVNKTSKTTTLYQANGSTVSFTEGGEGAFTAPVWTQDTLSGTSEAGYTLTLADQVKYKFAGSSGRLESVTDRNGNATTLAYSEVGRLETITDPAGRKITLSYNGEGLVESAKDPLGHVVKYAYEGGNLKSVTQPGEAGLRWQFKYDGSHRMTEMTDGRGGKTINAYNGASQVTSQKDPLGHTLKFEYEAFHTKITNEATGSVTDEHFTSNDEPFSITHGYGTASATTESFVYNAAGLPLSVTDGNGHTTEYAYSGAGDRTSMIDPNKHETKWTYDGTHDVETTTTPKGETTTIKRDAHGNPETIERPAPESKTQVTKYKYDSHGNLESMTDPLERTWKYEYDTAGDRTSETDPEGDKRTWEYNEDSQRTATVSPRGNVEGAEAAKYTTKTERDAQGRPLKITDPLGHTAKYTYDGDGNIETKTDSNSHTTTYTYDADNEPTKIKEPNGTVTETEYDGAGQVSGQTDGNKHVTKYVRNILEQVTEVEDPLKHKTNEEYDAAGNLKTLTDPAKRITTYKYDAANRLKEVTYSDEKTPTVKYEYDADGNQTGMTDGTGTTSCTYDQLDRLTESKDGHGDTTGYEYDLANQQTKITYPNGKAVTHAYDKAGRLEKVTDWLEHTTTFSYNPDSNLTTTTFPTSTSNTDKYAYNEADQMSEVKMTKGEETLASLTYKRDNNGQLETTTNTGLPGEEKPGYEYDTNSRLTKAGTSAYEYDSADNPTKTPGSTNTYDNANELEKGTGLTYTYDELGERTKTTPTSGPATTYGYDQAGNLTSVERPKEGEITAIEDTYAYNGNGLRASQTISGTTTFLTWNITEALPSILNDGTNSYIYGPAGVPVEQISSAGTVLYLHHDQQGSTRLLTSSTGAKEASFTYDAYGNTTGTTGTATTPLGYDAQYTSSDTGLIYLRARVYDPATAQFLSIDPITVITGAPYNYTNNNPVNAVDPSGLLSWEDVSEAAAGALDALTLGESTQLAGKIFGFNAACTSFGSAGELGAGLALGLGLFDGGTETELAAEAADQGVASVIKGYTRHGLAEAIQRDGGRGVSPSAILDAVKFPVSKTLQADGATQYVGRNAVVVVSKEGRVITTYGRNSAGLRNQP